MEHEEDAPADHSHQRTEAAQSGMLGLAAETEIERRDSDEEEHGRDAEHAASVEGNARRCQQWAEPVFAKNMCRRHYRRAWNRANRAKNAATARRGYLRRKAEQEQRDSNLAQFGIHERMSEKEIEQVTDALLASWMAEWRADPDSMYRDLEQIVLEAKKLGVGPVGVKREADTSFDDSES